MTSSKGFEHHFSIISKFVFYGFYRKKSVAFTLISFAVLKSDDCLSVQVPFKLPVQIPVQLLQNYHTEVAKFVSCHVSIDFESGGLTFLVFERVQFQLSLKPIFN